MTSSAVNGPPENRDTESPGGKADVLRFALDRLREHLPTSWEIAVETPDGTGGDHGVDAEVRLRPPDGGDVLVLVAAKRLLNTRDVPMALEALQRAASQRSGSRSAVSMLTARYLAPATRERIAQAGASYADVTGNLLLAVEHPTLFVRDRGTDRDPWRGPGRPRGTLQGPPAARVVRALVDFAPPFTVPELARRARASTGATYRVVDFVQGEELLDRRQRGPITDVLWRRLLERWSEDYGFERSNTVATFLEPRGLRTLTDRLRAASDLEYVVTGSLAAENAAAYAPARLATVYVKDIARAAQELKLRRVDSGANVALATGDYEVVFERDQRVGGLRVAAFSQVAVDLLTGPGRNPSEGVALLDWMGAHESQWRR